MKKHIVKGSDAQLVFRLKDTESQLPVPIKKNSILSYPINSIKAYLYYPDGSLLKKFGVEVKDDSVVQLAGYEDIEVANQNAGLIQLNIQRSWTISWKTGAYYVNFEIGMDKKGFENGIFKKLLDSPLYVGEIVEPIKGYNE